MPRLNSSLRPSAPQSSSAVSHLLDARILHPLRALARDRRGATAIFIAVAIVPLVAFVGLAIDTTRGYLVKSRLGTAIDAAALAGGRVFTSANRDADIQMYFAANFPPGYMSATTESLVITPDVPNKKLTVSVEATIPTTFMRLVGIDSIPVAAQAEVTISSQNLEVALVLDITGSMAGTKIEDLQDAANELVDIVVQDDQSLFYSKVAIAPYSQAVNVGTYADQVRGVIQPVPITNVEKLGTGTTGDPRKIQVTAQNHGFNNGDKVFITGVDAGFSSRINTNMNGTYNASSAPNFWTVGDVTTETPDTFTLRRGNGTDNINWDPSGTTSDWTGTYTSGGSIYCMKAGCQYLAFLRDSDNTWRVWPMSTTTCVTERTGANKYTDLAPNTTNGFIGPKYEPPGGVGDGNSCLSNPLIVPLTSDKGTLHTAIDALPAQGSTAGQIGGAWGWYLVSPNFASLWDEESQRPAPYGTPQLMKVVVFMTDGDFNTIYADGVVAQDSGSGSGGNTYKINKNSDNGNGFTQALALCNAMKAPGTGIIVYTVGFDLASIASSTARANAENFLNQCATNQSNVYFPETGADMKDAFRDIAFKISKLRLSK